MNANTMVVMQIETQRALDMREELLAVPGIDAVMIGPGGSFDLARRAGRVSASEDGGGDGSRFATPASAAASPRARRRGTPALARFWKERGMLFLGCSNDTGMMFERAAELVAQISAA